MYAYILEKIAQYSRTADKNGTIKLQAFQNCSGYQIWDVAHIKTQ